MKQSTTSAAVVPAAIVEEAWQDVGASFERFCLTAGIATLAGMMEEDAARLCGPRYKRADERGVYRWSKTKRKVGFHGGKIEIKRPRVRGREGGELSLPSWQAALSDDLLGQWALSLMLINVSTRKLGRAVRLPGSDIDPKDLAFYVVFGPAKTSLATLARVAGRRWLNSQTKCDTGYVRDRHGNEIHAL